MYYMGFTYTEAVRLPIWQRQWFLERIQKEMNPDKKDDSMSRAAHDNDPASRAMNGLARDHVPAKLRRFT